MKLGQKNLIYSMALAGIMVLFLLGYFVCMLPSLYVDYVMEQNLKSIREQHEAYMETGSYQGVRVKNITACFSVEIPGEGNVIKVTGKAFAAEITVRDERLQKILQQFREKAAAMGKEGEKAQQVKDDALTQEVEEAAGILAEYLQKESEMPLEIRFLYLQDVQEEYFNETVKVHVYGDNMFILEAGVEDQENKYTNYIAVEMTEDSFVMSMLPVVTPEMEEIRPIVLQSVPMLGAVIILLVLLFSRIYSRGIVSPIAQLANHAEEMKCAGDFSVERLSENWKHRQDEVGDLADTLDDFYGQIRESYRQLEEKNRVLAEENKRQEIFLRASSHQLKTPVAAALLLVDGMINEVGKYRDTRKYLPGVKEQLLSMKKMVEDILYLNHCADDIRFQQTDAGMVIRERLRYYQPEMADRELRVEFSGTEKLDVCTDEVLFVHIVDNLLSNAVKYTPAGERIVITLNAEEGREDMPGKRILIENYGILIPQELLPHIFDPFVSGSHGGARGLGSHGLGLYIAAYYAKKLGATIVVENGENSVRAYLYLPESFTSSSSEIHTRVIG